MINIKSGSNRFPLYVSYTFDHMTHLRCDDRRILILYFLNTEIIDAIFKNGANCYVVEGKKNCIFVIAIHQAIQQHKHNCLGNVVFEIW